MASGREHDTHGLVAATIILIGVAVFYPSGIDNAWALPVGTLIGAWLLSPDLDMWNTGPTKRWGPLKYLWAPYAWLHKHRGWSHSWTIGPAVRLLYLAIPVALVWSIWEFKGADLWLVWGCAGVYLGNWVHLIGDRHWPWS